MCPSFHFALSPDEPPLSTGDKLWATALPATRHAFSPSEVGEAAPQGMTYGDYFTAVQDFFSQDNFASLCKAVDGASLGRTQPADLESICVYLVKFGAFYHPSYIVVEAFDRTFSFVLNVAVSSEGRKIIDREYQCLSLLNDRHPLLFWPHCFGCGEGEGKGGLGVPMFLAQWFDGYYEFHLTGETPGNRQVVVWDTVSGHRMLRDDQVADCLTQAATILTCAYNPLTFEAIGQWHHAAGDFIIAVDGDRIDLKMITVRNYAPMIRNDQPDVSDILDALLLFLVEISLRLRLDRLNGIGPMVCHAVDLLPAICRGFFMGLQTAAPLYGLPEDFHTTVKSYAALHTKTQLLPMGTAIVEKAGFNVNERDLLSPIMDQHLATLADALKQ